jgi:hypothetical protein
MNNYDSRKVVIQVMGLPNQNLKRRSNYTVIVPYYRFSQTIQQICRTGGRIVNVTVHSSSLINTKTAQISLETETVFPKTSTPATIGDSESSATPKAQVVPETEVIAPQPSPLPETIEAKDSQEEIVSPPVESATKQSPITTSQIAKSERKTTQTRRQKFHTNSVKYPRKTMRNDSKVRGKKARRRSKPYLFN